MLFNDLKVGQQFKYPSLNEIFIKVEIPEGFWANNDTFGILEVAENRVWKHLESTKQFRTLQKVKKTEKKWVTKSIPKINSGSRIKFLADTEVYHTKIMVGVGGHIKHGWIDEYNKANVLSHDTAQEAWVEEDTVIETEEWLP